jgi:PAS domain S-box-containing protein
MPSEEDKSKEQKAAESEVESFRKDLGPFVVAAETTRMAMVFTDAKEPNHPLIFANDAFLSLIGYDREEVLGQSFDFLMVALAQVEAAFGGSSESDFENRFRRKDGSIFWAAVFISPVWDKAGDVVQHFASFVNLTKHKAGGRWCSTSWRPMQSSTARSRTPPERSILLGSLSRPRRVTGCGFGGRKAADRLPVPTPKRLCIPTSPALPAVRWHRLGLCSGRL